MKQLLIISVLALAGCMADGEVIHSPDVLADLPEGASVVRDEGNGWVSFDFGDSRVLMSPTRGVAPIGPRAFPEVPDLPERGEIPDLSQLPPTPDLGSK